MIKIHRNVNSIETRKVLNPITWGGGGGFSTPTVVHSNAKTSLLFQHHSCELKAMKNGCNNMCHMLIFVKSNNNYF